ARPIVPGGGAGAPAGILLQVLLVILLGRGERAGSDDLGHDRRGPLPAGVYALLDLLGDLALLLGGHEDRRAVLRPDVVALPVPGRRIVHAEGTLLEQILVRPRGGIPRPPA